MTELVIRGAWPRVDELVDAICITAETLGIWQCYAHEGRYHFSLGSGWSVALSADSADRIRVETCRLARPVTRMWTLASRKDRLAGLVTKMSAAPVA